MIKMLDDLYELNRDMLILKRINLKKLLKQRYPQFNDQRLERTLEEYMERID